MNKLGLSDDFIVQRSTYLIAAPALSAFLFMRLRRWTIPLLLLLLSTQRYAEAGDMSASYRPKAFYPTFTGLSFLRGDEPFRIVCSDYMLLPATATLYGLEDVRGYQAMKLAEWGDLLSRWTVRQGVWFPLVTDLRNPMLDFMNVRYAMVHVTDGAPTGWKVLVTTKSLRILENLEMLPRAFVPRTIVQLATWNQFDAATDIARDRVALTPDSPTDSLVSSSVERRNGTGRVRAERHGTELVLHSQLTSDAWIVLSEVAWPGWRADIAGRKLPVRRADYSFIAVRVPKGNHNVRVYYRPGSFDAGLLISGLTAVLLLSWSVRLRLVR